ncbi:MAG: metal ABC transporter permease [Deltaproteobacteria bacterium]
MLEFAFMQRALLASVIVGFCLGLLGFFVILRRLAFVGVGISHSAVAGVAAGVALGINPMYSAGAFAVIVAVAIANISRRVRLSEDAIIGVFFSASMALGLVILGMSQGYRQDLMGYLFGNILAVSATELWVLAGVAVGIVLILAVTFKKMLFVAFDPELARAYGHPVDRLDTLLLVVLAVTVVIGVRTVGILLVTGLLVIPAATAALLTHNFRSQLALAATLGAGASAGGLALAYRLDIAVGASVVLLAAGVFFATALLRPSSSNQR